ncbi:hypothetical protein ABPG74_010122 [Tetrahymena malaccensis]
MNKLTQNQIYAIAQQLLQGLSVLHSLNIIHLDIKPENILYCSKQNLFKIADFGISKILKLQSTSDQQNQIEQDQSSFAGGTYKYISFEILNQVKPFNVKSDIYSLGVTFLELVGIKVDNNQTYILRSGRLDQFIPIDFPYSEFLSQIVQQMICNINVRLSASELLTILNQLQHKELFVNLYSENQFQKEEDNSFKNTQNFKQNQVFYNQENQLNSHNDQLQLQDNKKNDQETKNKINNEYLSDSEDSFEEEFKTQSIQESKYKILDLLFVTDENGSFFRVINKQDNKLYLLRNIKFYDQEKIQNEINLIKKINHPNILRYVEHYYDEQETKTLSPIIIIYENAEVKLLEEILQDYQFHNQYVPEDDILSWLGQMCSTILHLQSINIAHRNIKPSVILVDINFQFYFFDFSIVCESQMGDEMIGTPLLIAPEIIQNKKGLVDYFLADVWSIGVTFYYICAQRFPFEGNEITQLAVNILTQQSKPIPKSYSEDLNFIIQNMLQKEPYKRYRLHQVQMVNQNMLNQLEQQQDQLIQNKSTKSIKNFQVKKVKARSKSIKKKQALKKQEI